MLEFIRGKGAEPMVTERTEKMGRAAEELAEVSRDSYRMVVDRAFAARESNARITRNFFEDTVEALQEQTALNLRTMEELAEQTRRRREALRELTRESSDAYEEFLGSLSGYYREALEESEVHG
jgi:hypothetical protein